MFSNKLTSRCSSTNNDNMLFFLFIQFNLNGTKFKVRFFGLRIHQIIRNVAIEAFFQPKVCLDSERIIGYEALLRWRDDQNNIQSPARIAAAFNDYELSSRIGEIMQHQVFKQITEWWAKGLHIVPISINAAPVEFMRDNFAEIFLKRHSVGTDASGEK